MKVLALLTDAFGGRGGLAKFNRDMLSATCRLEYCEEVVAFPRLLLDSVGSLPERLSYRTESAAGKAAYLSTVAKSMMRDGPFDLVICGHLNLLPLAAVVAAATGATLLLVIHGIEAWQPRKFWPPWLVQRADHVVAVSEYTKQRFLGWSKLPLDRAHVVPNCVDLSNFTPGTKPLYLLRRYGLENRPVLLSVGRLDSRERYKGHDEVLEVLGELVGKFPRLAYLIVGDGDDRERLRRKAMHLGLEDVVKFTSYIQESEKPDHYRLADAFVMPGRGEGFGIVYLEALACGVPVVVSNRDASQEIVGGGLPGAIADPDDARSIVNAISAVLRRHPQPRADLSRFSIENFHEKWESLLTTVVSATTARERPSLMLGRT